MPSKNYNGQNPLGEKRSQSFAQVELQVGRLQPALSLQSGSLQTPNGRIPSQKFVPTGTGAAVPCQLGKILVDSVNSTTELPKLKLLPGFLTGGGGSELIEPNNLTATIDNFVWLEAKWTCEVTTGGDQKAGGTLGDVTVVQGAAMPSDFVPAGAGEATARIPLGGWISNEAEEPAPVWVNQGCGSIQLFFCPGNGFFFGRSNVVTE